MIVMLSLNNIHHYILQGIFLTQRSNLHLLHWQAILYHYSTWEGVTSQPANCK